ncbi:carbohydrate ABC transporter permease [Saccharopolyspora sp. NPDC002376]
MFVAPSVVFFLVFFLWPAATAIQLSLYDYDFLSPPEFVGIENFVRLADDPRFWQALRNSVVFLIITLPMSTVLPLLLAMLVNQKIKGITFFRLAYYLPVVTSMVAIGIAWSFLFHRDGLLNWLLLETGILSQPIDWLLDGTWALPAVAFVEGWQGMGYYMMILLAGLQAVPREVLESAHLDGAGFWRRFVHILVPLMMPFLAVCALLGTIGSFQSFASIYVLTGGGPQGASTTLGYHIWSEAFENYDFGYASAIAMVLWLLLVVLAFAFYRLGRHRMGIS